MSRDFQVNGEALILVKGGDHLQLIQTKLPAADPIMSPKASELGLASDSIRITFNFNHRDIPVDDFGPNCPVNKLWLLATATIRMTLVHYDKDVLDTCVVESMGGGIWPPPNNALPQNNLPPNWGGLLSPAGTLLGNGTPIFSSGNHLISLSILSPVGLYSYRFPSCHLNGQPIEIPLGAQRSLVQLSWTAFPYQPLTTQAGSTTITPGGGTVVVLSGFAPTGEILSSGAILFDHTADQAF